MSRRTAAVAAVMLIAVVLTACSSSPSRVASESALHDNSITVGSFNFAESGVLAEIYSQALEQHGYRVRRAFLLGPRELVAPALFRGLIEVVPEYAGTALAFASVGATAPTSDVRVTHAALTRALASRHVLALEPAPAQDENTFVVSRATATREDLHTLSDLTGVAPRLTFGGPPECPTRSQCLQGLERVYRLKFEQFVRLDAGGPVTRQALTAGYVDIALLFSTDPAIRRDDLVALVDDRNLQPAENVIPLVRSELVDRFGPGVVHVLDSVSARLTTAALTDLNSAVEAGSTIASVASRWLTAEQPT